MRFDADELEEQNSLDSFNYKMNRRKGKGKKDESHVSKRKVRARTKRRAEISIGYNRGRRKRFLSAFGGRPSLSKQRSHKANSSFKKS